MIIPVKNSFQKGRFYIYFVVEFQLFNKSVFL